MSVRKMNGYSSQRGRSGPHDAFQMTHTATTTVIHARNVAVPMKRANRSEKRPRRSPSERGRNERRRLLGWSRRVRVRSATGGHLPRLVVALAPALGQQVVEDVVDRDGADQMLPVVDDRQGHEVV